MDRKGNETQFYLEEMQKMNNQMIDMQRELSRALRESKRMQEELRRRNDLKRALEIAEEANRAKMDFMSRMSHDLRTPMNVIMGLVAATIDDAEEPTAVRTNMANIRAASDYMLGLINDVLDMAKIEKGDVELKLAPYSYNEFILEMKTMFQAQCDAKNIKFTCNKAAFTPDVFADKLRIKQVIFNIISNAVKYTPSGGEISIYADGSPSNENDNRVFIEYRVTDNGIGMSKEFQKHVFEPFAQEDNDASPELKGSGLGLSITKRLVETMDGSIRIDSKKGEGTTVIVTIPFTLVTEQTKPKVSEPTQSVDYLPLLQGKKVLLAEDHPMNAMIARNMLEKKQIQVLHAENGEMAVELFQASPVGSLNAIIMDIRMPKMNGLDAAKKIRSLDRSDASTIPIIALSANTYPADVQASLDAGMNAHLAKPIDANVLYQSLVDCLQEKTP